MSFFVYVLRSLKCGSYYVGWAQDPEKRLLQHNQGLVRSTRHRRPLEIAYSEIYVSATDARKREAAIKKKKSRKFIDLLVSQGRTRQ